MKKSILSLAILLACCGDRTKTHWVTKPLGNNLYAEYFYTYRGGVYGGDVVSVYLTDSMKINQMLGKLEGGELFEYNIQEDILTYWIVHPLGKTEPPKTIDVSLLRKK